MSQRLTEHHTCGETTWTVVHIMQSSDIQAVYSILGSFQMHNTQLESILLVSDCRAFHLLVTREAARWSNVRAAIRGRSWGNQSR